METNGFPVGGIFSKFVHPAIKIILAMNKRGAVKVLVSFIFDLLLPIFYHLLFLFGRGCIIYITPYHFFQLLI
jgi:hypothetical protein